MDRERFDALARLLATTGPRRAALGALLGAGLLVHRGAAAKPGKGKGKRKGKGRGKRRPEEVTVCHTGETLQVSRGAVEGILLDGGAVGPCPSFGLTLGGSGPCTSRNDCPDVPCRTKDCDDGACVYTPVGDGPSPNGLCDTHCCGITCCASDSAVCLQGRCCVPNGPFDCGRDRCTDACAGCDYCVTFADGSSRCAVDVLLSCDPCPANGNCPTGLSSCIASFVNRRTKQTVTVGQRCGNPSLQSTCGDAGRCGP